MSKITIRGTSVTLPVLPEGAELTRVPSLASGGIFSGFEFGDASMRALDVRDVRLLDGKVHAVRAEAVSIMGARVQSVEFSRCELGSPRWSGGKISRTRFDSCRLLGARFENVTLEHVVFTDCKLDYAAIARIRASGPVMFIRCSLREADFADCDLAGCLFDGCELTSASFGEGWYAGCDLRGNDLSAVNGAHHLERVVLDRSQLIELAAALAAELDVTFGDELDD
jgi:uncharacterized protein YjbI with pentapeptide repeats